MDEFQMWIAHPDRVIFIATEDNPAYATRAGWWRTDWRGTEQDVRARGGVPERRVTPKVAQ